MNSGLSTLTTDHIVISGCLLQEPPPELAYRGYGECPGLWEYVDSSICTLSTLQPLSLEYTAKNPSLLLPWVHHWTSLTALHINCYLDISHSVNELLLALPELRTLNIMLHYYPNRAKYKPSLLSNLQGLSKLQSLDIEAVLLDANLAELNLRQLALDFSTMPLEDNPKGIMNMNSVLESLHYMTELQRLELVSIEPSWIKKLAQNMPPNLKELRFYSNSYYCPHELLDELLFALPPGLHLFDTKLDLKSAPRYLEWIESWSGMWTRSPLDRWDIEANEIEPLSRAFSKCTQLMHLLLNLCYIDDTAPLQQLFTNATHFRELDLVFDLPNDAMMTTLFTVANHVCHLTTLHLFHGPWDKSPLPTRFFDLRFPELQDFTWQCSIVFSQWPLLRHFLEEHKQLKSLRVELDDLDAPKEDQQQLWTLFPPTLEHITLILTVPGGTYPYFDQLPNYLGQSQWRKLFMTCSAPFPPDFTLPSTALLIENLAVGAYDLPDSLKARLAANKKRNQSLEVLASPAKAPLWCADE